MAAATAYFAGTHAFDALYALTCKEFSYFAAMGIMYAVLAGVSIVLVMFHAVLKHRTGWDVLGLESLNNLRDEEDNQSGRRGRWIQRWLLRRRLTILVLGPCFIGPPVVTILLRKDDNIVDSAFYILSGTLISVVTWVTVWKGFWTILRKYVSPLLGA
ncbi:MAG: hypothetical protein HZC51_00905 [Nitrospirae bacterium]|nr:hypothetical protein [Nitrospirota bacterium]